MKKAIMLLTCLALWGCSCGGEQSGDRISPQEEAAQLQSSIASQKEKVRTAESIYQEEAKRLKTMQDSLQAEVQRDIALGLSEKQAADIEQARIRSQKAVAKAAEKNLKHQQEYLVLLKTRLQALTGKP